MTAVKNNATFLLTPPQREAVEELARANADYKLCLVNYLPGLPDAARRLHKAQDAVGIQLVSEIALRPFLEAA